MALDRLIELAEATGKSEEVKASKEEKAKSNQKYDVSARPESKKP